MIMDNFMNITGDISSIIMAFDNALGNWAIITILFAFVIVLGFASTTITGDFVTSFNYSLFLFSVIGFLIYLIQVDGVRMLSFDKWSVLLTLTGLITLYNQISKRQ